MQQKRNHSAPGSDNNEPGRVFMIMLKLSRQILASWLPLHHIRQASTASRSTLPITAMSIY